MTIGPVPLTTTATKEYIHLGWFSKRVENVNTINCVNIHFNYAVKCRSNKLIGIFILWLDNWSETAHNLLGEHSQLL